MEPIDDNTEAPPIRETRSKVFGWSFIGSGAVLAVTGIGMASSTAGSFESTEKTIGGLGTLMVLAGLLMIAIGSAWFFFVWAVNSKKPL